MTHFWQDMAQPRDARVVGHLAEHVVAFVPAHDFGGANIGGVDNGAGTDAAKYNSLQRATSALSVVIFASSCSTFLSRLFMSARNSSR